MRLGEESRRRRLVTVELIPDRVIPQELSYLKRRIDAITIPALRNGVHDPSYPTDFRVTPQQRSIASALIVRRTGIEAVPSLTCRDCRQDDLSLVSRLVEGGLQNFLVVYGDRLSNPDPNGYEFRKTEHLIRRVLVSNNGNSPSVGAVTNQYAPDQDREIARTLARADSGAEYVLTNTAFDKERVLEHRDALRSAGLDAPLFIQVSIPHSLDNLVFVSERFGIPVSDRLKRMLRAGRADSGIKLAARAFDELRTEANAIHFSYLLRKRNPIPVYCRLLDLIGVKREPVAVPLEPVSRLSSEPVVSY